MPSPDDPPQPECDFCQFEAPTKTYESGRFTRRAVRKHALCALCAATLLPSAWEYDREPSMYHMGQALMFTMNTVLARLDRLEALVERAVEQRR